MKNFFKVLSLAAASSLVATTVDAQVVYPYTMNFDNAVRSGTATGYATVTAPDTLTENGVKWHFIQGLIGNDANDVKIGTKSLRMRTNTGNVFMSVTDLPQGADVISFSYGRSNFSGDRTGVAPKILVSYSTNQGTSWVNLDTLDLTNNTSIVRYQSASLNITSPVRFKINTIAGDDAKRFNIDSIEITTAVQASNIFLTANTPVGTILPSVNELTLTFNEDVVKGIGNVTLNEVGGTPVVFDVATSADVTVANNVVTVANIALTPSKSYYVTYDSTAFVDANGLKSAGIYNNSTWTFTTTASSLQSFKEEFTNCGTNTMGVFTQNSVLGDAEFFCDTYNDSTSSFTPPYITINGGTGSASFLNEDYLVTVIPVDLTELDVRTVNLYYAEKRRFGGDGVTRGIYYSQNYAGDAAAATWTPIEAALPAITSTGTFVRRSHNITTKIDADQPFYLAFKYASVADTTNRNWSWSLDDIELEVIENDSTISINPLAANNIHVSVLGIAKSNLVNVRVATLDNMDAQVSIFDLTGRQIYADKASFKAGTQVMNINNASLKSGMYILKLDSSKGTKAVKFIVE